MVTFEQKMESDFACRPVTCGRELMAKPRGHHVRDHHILTTLRRLSGALLCLAASPALEAGPTAPAQPNIVLILADDLGYGDLSSQNPNSKIRTPRLDSLASQGMRLSSAHAPSALCTPTRYSIMTGQFCWRSRLKSGVLNMWDEPLLAPERLTLPGMLRGNGYATGCFGKWHLGLSWPFIGAIPSGFDTTVKPTDLDWSRRIGGGPVDHGFDYFFGINLANQPPYAYIQNDRIVGVPTAQYGTVTGLQSHWAGPGVPGWDWTQVAPTIVSNAVDWLQQRSDQTPARPFFLYLALPGPHQPIAPTAEFQGTSQAGIYGDYVQELDAAVGQVLDALDAAGVANNTLLIFTSDNGPDEFTYQRLQQYGHSSMGALRGIKNDLWEGGHRVPFIARWPGIIAAGSASSQVICLVDLMRTAADLLGVQLPVNAAEDSVSFLPVLLGTATAPPRSSLILESGPGEMGVWTNNWMFIDFPTGDGHVPELEPLWFKQSRGYALTNPYPGILYNLSQDLAEGANLYQSQPALVVQLQTSLRKQRAAQVWLGSQSGSWSAPANWSLGYSPQGCDLLLSGGSNFSQSLGTNFWVNTLALRGLNQAVRLSAGGPFGLTLSNGIDLSAASSDLSISAPLTLAQSQVWTVCSNRTLTISAPVMLNASNLMVCGRGNVTLSNTVAGPGRLIFRGSGFLSLSSSNSFSGGTEISGGGFVVAQNSWALGSGAVEIPNSSTLQIEPGVSLTNTLSIAGCGAVFQSISRGAITTYHPGNATVAGPVQLSSDAGFYAHQTGGRLTLGGPITGVGNLTIMRGTGTVIFAANNLYTGATIVQGKLQLSGGPDRLPAATAVCLSNSACASLDLNGNSQTVGALSGGGANGGNVLLGNATLTINQAGPACYAGSLLGTGGITKTNTGALTLSGTCSYTGATTVSGGALVVNGTLLNSPVIVTSALLGGTGRLTGPVTIQNSGVLFPGTGLGTLTVSNDLALADGSTTCISLDAVHRNSSQIKGVGHITYGGTLVVTNLTSNSALAPGQSFQIFNASTATGQFSAITPAAGRGLGWKFSPATGTLSVVARPVLSAIIPDGNTLLLSWSGTNFHLQGQTNPLSTGLSTNWFNYPGGPVNALSIPISLSNQSVFFRLSSD